MWVLTRITRCGFQEGVVKLLWSPASQLVFTGCLDGKVRAWDGRTGNCERVFEGHGDSILDLAISRYVCFCIIWIHVLFGILFTMICNNGNGNIVYHSAFLDHCLLLAALSGCWVWMSQGRNHDFVRLGRRHRPSF
jgi:WD40 repeat protein